MNPSPSAMDVGTLSVKCKTCEGYGHSAADCKIKKGKEAENTNKAMEAKTDDDSSNSSYSSDVDCFFANDAKSSSRG